VEASWGTVISAEQDAGSPAGVWKISVEVKDGYGTLTFDGHPCREDVSLWIQ
jgi:hypothetical protein